LWWGLTWANVWQRAATGKGMVEDSPGAAADGGGRPGWVSAEAGSATPRRSDYAGKCGIRGIER